MTLIDRILDNISKNADAKSAIDTLFRKYGEQVLNESTIDISEDEIGLCLRIADIFSKVPNESDDSEHYHSLAQEIIYMLNFLLPKRKDVDLVSDSVLSSLSNYPVRKNMGLSEEEKNYGLLRLIGEKIKMGSLEIPGEKGKFFLLPQKIAYDGFKNRSFSYSGPTSMGKTFLMTTFIKQRIDEGHDGNFAIIVPTKALINELKGEVIREFKNEILEKNYRVISSANDLQLEAEHNFILVMTPERLMYFLIKYREIILDYVFFDEAHKISENDPRSSFYYKDISLLSKNSNKIHIIFSSPNIPNPDIYSKLYGGGDGKSYRSQFSPVSQFKFYINRESKSFSIWNDFSRTAVQLPRENITDNDYTLVDYVFRLTKDNQQSIVYVNSVDTASELAQEMYEGYGNRISLTQKQKDELEDLSIDIEKGITRRFSLCRLIKKGVAFHTGYLPPTLRARLEALYKSGAIRFLFCTSTLIEGVNLPANNLFVTSIKNGQSNMTSIEFKNLAGRVGRISTTSYGNVFLVSEDEKTSKRMEELAQSKAEDQELSLEKVLTPENSKAIVSSFAKGELPYSDSIKDGDLLVQKLSLIYAKDIAERTDTYFSKEVEKRLTSDGNIKKEDLFKLTQNIKQEDDINVNFIQDRRLREAIFKDGLHYPDISTLNDDKASYEIVLDFLKKLSDVFLWKVYERDDLGRGNSISQYAVVLLHWIMGSGLRYIVDSRIDYYNNKRWGKTIKINHKEELYHATKRQVDYLISNTLKDIEGIILFKLSNYFLKFSNIYKEFTNQKSFNNDWYEFIEFGTHEPVIIFLQRIGFSRETALYIRKNSSDFIEIDNGKIFLKKDILDSTNKDIQKELKDLDSNIREYIHS